MHGALSILIGQRKDAAVADSPSCSGRSASGETATGYGRVRRLARGLFSRVVLDRLAIDRSVADRIKSALVDARGPELRGRRRSPGRGPGSGFVRGEQPIPVAHRAARIRLDWSRSRRLFHLGDAAERRGVITAYPDGTTDSTGSQFWNATDACCNFDGSSVDDSKYLVGVVAAIKAHVAVDPKRIYVMGHSNGGFMSYRTACDHADVFAAIISLAAATFAQRSRLQTDGASLGPGDPRDGRRRRQLQRRQRRRTRVPHRRCPPIRAPRRPSARGLPTTAATPRRRRARNASTSTPTSRPQMIPRRRPSRPGPVAATVRPSSSGRCRAASTYPPSRRRFRTLSWTFC